MVAHVAPVLLRAQAHPRADLDVTVRVMPNCRYGLAVPLPQFRKRLARSYVAISANKQSCRAETSRHCRERKTSAQEMANRNIFPVGIVQLIAKAAGIAAVAFALVGPWLLCAESAVRRTSCAPNQPNQLCAERAVLSVGPQCQFVWDHM